jgi:EmrB/QacA subfamily drug resistance transporter
MNVLDTTIVNVALPQIQRDLHFSQGNLTWVINAFLITYGSFLLLAGRLGDLVGRKRVFLAGVALFTLASAACGLAPSAGVLIAARFVQGVGAAFSASVILAIIVTEFPEPGDRARAMSAYVFVAVAGGSLGLLLGGVLTQAVSWHWIFFVNAPIGVATLIAGRALVRSDTGQGLGAGIDWLGSALVTIALMGAVYAIIQASAHGWGSSQVLVPGAAAAVQLAAFFALESRLANPILPLRILRLRGLVGSSAVRGLVVTGMYSTFFLGALYLEHVLGYGALETGLAFMPWTISVGILSLGVTARLIARFGAMRVLVVGLLIITAGLGLLTSTGTHTSFFPTIFLAYLLVGLGIGSSFMPLLTIAMADVPHADAGLASGIVNVSQQVFGALGLAVLGTIAASRTKALGAAGHTPAVALLGGYHRAFEVGAVCVLAGIALAIAVLARRGPAPAQAAVPEAEPATIAPSPRAPRVVAVFMPQAERTVAVSARAPRAGEAVVPEVEPAVGVSPHPRRRPAPAVAPERGRPVALGARPRRAAEVVASAAEPARSAPDRDRLGVAVRRAGLDDPHAQR